MTNTPEERAKAIVKWYYPLKDRSPKFKRMVADLETRIAKEIQEAVDEAMDAGITLAHLCGSD